MSLSGVAQRLPRLWFRRRFAAPLLPLLPLSWLFRGLVSLRRRLYRYGVLASVRLPVPVIAVGNLTVGGSGKTPLVLWLVEQLRAAGWHPGIISRGYAREGDAVLSVDPSAPAQGVGDEPLLLARRSGAPVFVGRDRVAAAQALLVAHPACDVIVSDDGLQHYRMQRAVEIAVFDGRGAGNGRLLPAGPLREPLARLGGVDALVWNGGAVGAAERARVTSGLTGRVPQFGMRLYGARFVHLASPERVCTADDLRGRPLCAVAGIGDPQRFFAQLSSLGLTFEARPFPDHHVYSAADLACSPGVVLLMTEKDAVKCSALPIPEAWVLPVAADILPAADGCLLFATILEKLDGRSPA